MYNAQSVIERVQSALKSAGISQKAMLQDCGMSENTLKRMNDERGMSSFYLARIADYLGVSVDYLLGRQNETAPAESRSGKGAYMPESEWAQILSQMSPESLIQLRDYTRYLLWKQAQAAGDSQ